MTCKWIYIDVDQGLHQYSTKDGDVFIPVSPVEFKFSFCPFCGERLVVEQELFESSAAEIGRRVGEVMPL